MSGVSVFNKTIVLTNLPTAHNPYVCAAVNLRCNGLPRSPTTRKLFGPCTGGWVPCLPWVLSPMRWKRTSGGNDHRTGALQQRTQERNVVNIHRWWIGLHALWWNANRWSAMSHCAAAQGYCHQRRSDLHRSAPHHLLLSPFLDTSARLDRRHHALIGSIRITRAAVASRLSLSVAAACKLAKSPSSAETLVWHVLMPVRAAAGIPS
eukprot:g8615.t1